MPDGRGAPKPRPRRGEAKARYTFLADRSFGPRWLWWPLEAAAFLIDAMRLIVWGLGALARLLDPR